MSLNSERHLTATPELLVVVYFCTPLPLRPFQISTIAFHKLWGSQKQKPKCQGYLKCLKTCLFSVLSSKYSEVEGSRRHCSVCGREVLGWLSTIEVYLWKWLGKKKKKKMAWQECHKSKYQMVVRLENFKVSSNPMKLWFYNLISKWDKC